MRFIGTDIDISVEEMLNKYMPRIYANSKVIKEINRIDAVELENIYAIINNILDQFFISTATWGLDKWEEEYGIQTDRSLSYETRRSMLYAKKNAKNSFTKEAATSLLRQITNNQNAIFKEINEENSFETIYSVDDNIDFNVVREAFASVKPAHLYHIVGQIITASIDIFKISDKCIIDIKSKYTPEDIGESDKAIVDFYLDGVFLLDGSADLSGQISSGSNGFINFREEMKITYDNNGSIDIEIV